MHISHAEQKRSPTHIASINLGGITTKIYMLVDVLIFVYFIVANCECFDGKENDVCLCFFNIWTFLGVKDLGCVSEDSESIIIKIIPNIHFFVFSFVNKMRDGGFRDPG